MRTLVIVMIIAAILGAARMALMIKAANDGVATAALRLAPPPPPEPTEEQKKLAKVLEQVREVASDDEETMYEKAKALPKGHHVIFLTLAFEEQAMDGGFDRYFWNHRGRYNQQTVDALKAIGASGCLGPFVQAIHVFESKRGMFDACRNSPNIEKTFDLWTQQSKLAEYDALFCSVHDNLDALRARYIRDHPELFPIK